MSTRIRRSANSESVNYAPRGRAPAPGDPPGTKSHWDGGIYLTGFGAMSNMTRVVYFSNLSIGVK